MARARPRTERGRGSRGSPATREGRGAFLCSWQRAATPSAAPETASHALRRLDAQELEPPPEHPRGQIAQREPRPARGLDGLQHGASLVEGREEPGDLEQVATEVVGFE